MSWKSSVHFMLRAHLSSDQGHFKCPIVRCASGYHGQRHSGCVAQPSSSFLSTQQAYGCEGKQWSPWVMGGFLAGIPQCRTYFLLLKPIHFPGWQHLGALSLSSFSPLNSVSTGNSVCTGFYWLIPQLKKSWKNLSLVGTFMAISIKIALAVQSVGGNG